jgi:hypothetical protein
MTADHDAKDMNVAKFPVQRLCNEIQLFDLCDLEVCSFKEGKFCANEEHLAAFEQISDAETVRPGVSISEEPEEGEDVGDEEYDEDFEDEEIEDERVFDDD